jgi:thiamine-monophosphate kinase
MGEFELIAQFFTRPHHPLGPGVELGIGDDCALLAPTPGMRLAISSDMLVQGRHFFADVDPRTLGHKALAVNLSDLAACGARPLAFTLALALPQADAPWLQAFAEGMFALADQHGCALIGGDTTQGPLNICITVFGEVPPGQALLRSGAQVGDDVYVSGTLGDAHVALQVLLGHVKLDDATFAKARQRLEQPTPRVALGQALRGIATAAADVSDGLVGDLGHILKQSGVGATLRAQDAMQLLAACAVSTGATGQFVSEKLSPISPELHLQSVLAGGDDYELVFTADPAQRAAVHAAALASGTPVHCIGQIEATPGLRVVDSAGQPVAQGVKAFDHFATHKG